MTKTSNPWKRRVKSHSVETGNLGFGSFIVSVTFTDGYHVSCVFRAKGWGGQHVRDAYQEAKRYLAGFGIA